MQTRWYQPHEIETRPVPREPDMIDVRAPGGVWSAVRAYRLPDAIASACCPHCRANGAAICHHTRPEA